MSVERIHDQLRGLATPVERLEHDKRNARKHSPRNLAAIARSLDEHGQRKPLVAQRVGERLVVRAGNGTLEAARSLGWTHLAVVVVEEGDKAATRYALADNRTAELAEWDDETLRELLGEVCDSLDELPDLGWEPDEVGLGDPSGESSSVDAEPKLSKADELQRTWGTETGQLWQLGAHRLLCGDSTKPEDVARLMGGEKADLCFTSPPYALGKSVSLSGNKSASARGSAYDVHDDGSDGWKLLMEKWFSASSEVVSGAWVVNVQPLAGNKRALVRFIADNADRLVDIATWDKGQAAPPMAAGVLSSRFEWLVIFSANRNASRAVPLSSWHGTVQSVYSGPPQRENEFFDVHAATMPMHLPTWVLGTLCDKSRLVFEPFAGTGTTIISCEQLGRRCFGIEISPAYCAVILQRYQDATGKTPTRLP